MSVVSAVTRLDYAGTSMAHYIDRCYEAAQLVNFFENGLDPHPLA
ncbi:MAG: hypothetical protein CFH37_00592 [Alphaproteobacteria bacterium MarineAlpha9_Bin7]|nr:MAG: hypothetical protein CFH37_00592 [Alphaproteobacteria bacterium MarineAlpha9_Bin7]